VGGAATATDMRVLALLGISNHYPMEVGLALKATSGALPRLLVYLKNEVRILLGYFGWGLR